MGKMQRNKGAAGEREWCAMLEAAGCEAERVLGQARDGGGDVATPPYLWEVKRHAAFSVYAHMEQAIEAAPKYDGCRIPAVALRGDHREWLVVMRASDILPLLYSIKALS